MKIGRREFDIHNDDLILDNGFCYQLETQTYRKDWYDHYPVMSKTQFNKLLKENKLILVSEKFSYVDSTGKDHYTRYYRFNVE